MVWSKCYEDLNHAHRLTSDRRQDVRGTDMPSQIESVNQKNDSKEAACTIMSILSSVQNFASLRTQPLKRAAVRDSQKLVVR
jgi:hypothetical protein